MAQTAIPSRFTKQFGYQHTFCPNVVATTEAVCLILAQKRNMSAGWSLKDLSRFFSVCSKTVSVGYDRLLLDERKLVKAHFCATEGTTHCYTDHIGTARQHTATVPAHSSNTLSPRCFFSVIHKVTFKYNEIIIHGNCHKMGRRRLD